MFSLFGYISEFVTFLLQSIGTYVDPTPLIEKIKDGMEIPGLKNALVKMLYHYNLQVSVQEGCKKILVTDYFNLFRKLVHCQQKGIAVSNEMVCGVCQRKIVISGNVLNFCLCLAHYRKISFV